MFGVNSLLVLINSSHVGRQLRYFFAFEESSLRYRLVLEVQRWFILLGLDERIRLVDNKLAVIAFEAWTIFSADEALIDYCFFLGLLLSFWEIWLGFIPMVLENAGVAM